MDVIKLSCPSCGGSVTRKKTEYSAKCPYCGNEIGFDDLKEEAQVEYYNEKIKTMEKSKEEENSNRMNLKNWMRFRNGMFVIMTVIHTIGWTAVGKSRGEDSMMWIGMLLLIAAWTILFLVTLLLAVAYPNVDIYTGKSKDGSKGVTFLKIYLKLVGTGLLLCMSTVFIAWIIQVLLWGD